MKKRVIAVLLSTMMVAGAAPAAVYADEDFASEVSVTADAPEEVTEDETSGEDFSLEVSDESTDSEDTVDIEDADESADVIVEEDAAEEELSGELTEEDIFSDSVGDAQTVTLNGTSFDTAKTYIVPIVLRNARDHASDSAAVACPGKFGTLTFKDGKAYLQTNVRSVTVGTLTDYAYNFKVYQTAAIGTDQDKKDVQIVKEQTVQKADKSGTHVVPETISFELPESTYTQDGVYMSMYVDAMGYAPDAYLQIDYANAKEKGDASLNYTTEVGTAQVDQFGKYTVTSKVTVTDGRITDVALSGEGFGGTHASDNQMYLSTAINGSLDKSGMKDRLIGLYMNDAQKLNDLDTVTGATVSSNAIKNATMSALGVKIEQEEIPEAPTEKPVAGLYTIDIKNRTDVVDHGLLGDEKKVSALLRVDDQGKMWLTYKMASDTPKEPLWVLGYNGYYSGNDTTQAPSMEGVTYATEEMDAPTIGKSTVVTDITVPLDSVRQTYINNVYLYVEAMKNLNGETSGVVFDHGKFNINSTVTLYWDTLTNISEDSDSSKLATLSDGVYKLSGEMVKVNKVDYSMSNNAINHNIKLTVKNGIPYVSMNFNGMNVSGLHGYLKNLNYYKTGYGVDKYGNPTGDMTPVTVDSYQKYTDGSMFSDDFDTDYPNDVTFPLVQEALTQGATYIPMQVYVPVMEALSKGSGTQNVYLKLDYSTLQKTTADDKDFAEQEETPSRQQAQTITGVSSSYAKKVGDAAFNLGAKANTALSYSSSNTGVAVVNANGNVTVKGVGSAKITIKAAETDAYAAAMTTVTVNVSRGNQTISGNASYNVVVGKKNVSLGIKAPGRLTFKSSNTKVVTVDKYGRVTAKKTGTAKITVSAAQTSAYNAASRTITVKVVKPAPTIKAKSVSKTVKYASVKKKAQSFTVKASVNSKGKLSYKKTSGSSKLTVNAKTGKITVKKGTRKGTYTAKIRISAAAKGKYASGTKTVTVKVVVK